MIALVLRPPWSATRLPPRAKKEKSSEEKSNETLISLGGRASKQYGNMGRKIRAKLHLLVYAELEGAHLV